MKPYQILCAEESADLEIKENGQLANYLQRENNIFSELDVLFLAMNTASSVLVCLTCFSQRASHLFYTVNRK